MISAPRRNFSPTCGPYTSGIDKERLSHGDTFPTVFEHFREWCGEDPVFVTWGYDDRRIMEQNIIIHDLDWDWIADWINLQLIYNIQTGGDKNHGDGALRH